MKPFDSLQLAAALNLPGAGLTFVCADQRLCEIARIEDLTARRFNNEVHHLGKQKGCYTKWLWEKTMFI